MNTLKGKTALITGASSGIGRAAALLFAAEGANVVLAARRREALEATLMEIGPDRHAIMACGDVSIEEDCAAICAAAAEAFGSLDILVNNAGMVDKHIPVTRCDTDWWQRVCAVNQDSVFFMCRAALPYLQRSEKAAIVNVSSIGGVYGSSGIAYSASKAAILAMTRNIAIQFAGSGIRCNAVCPGPTPTPINTPDKIAAFDQEFMGICNKHLDLSLPCVSADDQARAIFFLASPYSEGITGQYLIVDNGMTL